MKSLKVFTIGFTKTSAASFFDRLLNAGVTKILDVRLHNSSQLAGFAKADDLPYFLKTIGGIEYSHQPLLAPTDEILKVYKKQKGDWDSYAASFLALMREREIEKRLKPELLNGACLLCSEATPHYCHRRLVCDYLDSKWEAALNVRHL